MSSRTPALGREISDIVQAVEILSEKLTYSCIGDDAAAGLHLYHVYLQLQQRRHLTPHWQTAGLCAVASTSTAYWQQQDLGSDASAWCHACVLDAQMHSIGIAAYANKRQLRNAYLQSALHRCSCETKSVCCTLLPGNMLPSSAVRVHALIIMSGMVLLRC